MIQKIEVACDRTLNTTIARLNIANVPAYTSHPSCDPTLRFPHNHCALRLLRRVTREFSNPTKIIPPSHRLFCVVYPLESSNVIREISRNPTFLIIVHFLWHTSERIFISKLLLSDLCFHGI